MDFAGKVAFVMGGTTGIGRASAELLAERGARLTVFGAPGGDDIIAAGDAIAVIEGDGSVAAAVAAAIDATIARFGGLDVLICAAAVHPYGDAVETDEAVWDRAIAVNLKSMYLTAHYGIPHLLARGGGAIVNVASNQGSASNPRVAAYSTSKGAILAFTRTLAIDFSPRGIRANSVSPGPIDTPMLRAAADRFGEGRSLDAVYDDWGRRLPIRRVGAQREIAEVIAFLASSRASFCTGADLVADGGLLASLGF